ncbi:unnamed protein product [Prorocentrum cordatum]|uniref:Solute carrier family 40 protein n=1 Tax=Prorocentrum cordatum TaxID=2364126 RepID=A0ABN9T8M2_9DINO|nr:unnamed protein product [Polarella glacialis]
MRRARGWRSGSSRRATTGGSATLRAAARQRRRSGRGALAGARPGPEEPGLEESGEAGVLAAATCSSLPAAAWEGALAAMAVCGVFAPVLALSLVPRVADEPGCAYGALDSLKSLTQAAATLALGELREAGGYSLALACCCGVLAAAAALAVALARGAGSPAAAPKVAHEDLCSARTCAQSCAQKTSAAALVAAGV